MLSNDSFIASLVSVTITDDNIKQHKQISDFIKTLSNKNLSISNLCIVGNPGWDYRIITENVHNKWQAIEVELEINYEEDDYYRKCHFDWFFTLYRDGEFISVGGPQYLSVVLEAFRCFITGNKFNLQETEEDLKRFKSELDLNNPLLAWLSKFALKHSDKSMELGYVEYIFTREVIISSSAHIFED